MPIVTIILQVHLPTDITPRQAHSAVMFGSGAHFRVIVLFGGNIGSPTAISETTLLLMSESPRINLYSVVIL